MYRAVGAGAGVISGDHLQFPASGIPAMTIYAVSASNPHGFCSVKTSSDQTTYSISGLPAAHLSCAGLPTDRRRRARRLHQVRPLWERAALFPSFTREFHHQGWPDAHRHQSERLLRMEWPCSARAHPLIGDADHAGVATPGRASRRGGRTNARLGKSDDPRNR